jgi:hypothetical protein
VLIRGACHCGNIRLALKWAPEPTHIPARACGCAFCRKHGALWTACPDGALAVTIADAALVQRYAFGTRTADFHVCRTCGAVPVVTSRIDGELYALVSVNAFEGVDPALLRHVPADFEVESAATRLARRKRNWIARVEFT